MSFPLMKLPCIPLKKIMMEMSLNDLLQITNPKLFRWIGLKAHVDLTLSQQFWIVTAPRPLLYFNGFWSLETDDKADILMKRLAETRYLLPGNISRFTICPTLIKGLLLCDNLPKEVEVFAFDSVMNAKGQPYQYSRRWEVVSEERRKSQEEEKIQIENLLNLVNVKKGIVLGGPGRPKTELAFEKECISIEFSDWVTLETLSKLKSRIVHLNRSVLLNEEVNEFLKQFKDGKVGQNLEVLTIEGNDHDASWEPEDVMNGLETRRETDYRLYLTSDPSEYEFLPAFDFLPYDHWRMKEGIDLAGAWSFTRVDGMTCSVVFDKVQLVMYVYERDVEKMVKERKRRRMEEKVEEAKRRRFD